jgi:hypothetical protein
MSFFIWKILQNSLKTKRWPTISNVKRFNHNYKKIMFQAIRHNIILFNLTITSRFQIAINVKTIIIGHVLNNKYDQLLSFLR